MWIDYQQLTGGPCSQKWQPKAPIINLHLLSIDTFSNREIVRGHHWFEGDRQITKNNKKPIARRCDVLCNHQLDWLECLLIKVSSLKKELVNPFIDAKFGNLNFQFKYLANWASLILPTVVLIASLIFCKEQIFFVILFQTHFSLTNWFLLGTKNFRI